MRRPRRRAVRWSPSSACSGGTHRGTESVPGRILSTSTRHLNPSRRPRCTRVGTTGPRYRPTAATHDPASWSNGDRQGSADGLRGRWCTSPSTGPAGGRRGPSAFGRPDRRRRQTVLRLPATAPQGRPRGTSHTRTRRGVEPRARCPVARWLYIGTVRGVPCGSGWNQSTLIRLPRSSSDTWRSQPRAFSQDLASPARVSSSLVVMAVSALLRMVFSSI